MSALVLVVVLAGVLLTASGPPRAMALTSIGLARPAFLSRKAAIWLKLMVSPATRSGQLKVPTPLLPDQPARPNDAPREAR